MSNEKALLGAALGVGAIAAAPFTGGGSVLGVATLLGSLSGVGTGLATVAAGVVGYAMGDLMNDCDINESYYDGYLKAKKKYASEAQLVEEEYGPQI